MRHTRLIATLLVLMIVGHQRAFPQKRAALVPRNSIVNGSSPAVDLDQDGIPDEMEQVLAERYAPVLLMDPNEPNFPMDVAAYLKPAELWSYDESCSHHAKFIRVVVSGDIPVQTLTSCGSFFVNSHSTWSPDKKHTFYVRSVDAAVSRGSNDTSRWTTYFHAYPNQLHGTTIQYWRFYAYDTAFLGHFHIAAASHGGDWEGVHLILGPPPASKPESIRLLGHKDMEVHRWSDVISENGHAIIRVEKGGHASFLASTRDLAARLSFIEHQSWSGGRVRRPLKSQPVGPQVMTYGGELRNIGEKTNPMKGMEFILFSGLWGTREAGFLGYYRSGYWGPAFNNSSLREDGFFAAWCEGSSEPLKEVWRPEIGLVRECFPSATVP
jgi:hypothetical protein